MRKKIYRFALIAILAFPVLAQGQTEEQGMPKTRLMWVPQYLFNSGMRFELEKKLSNNLWIVASPTLYYKDSPDKWLYGNSNIYGRKGLSTEAWLKWYPEQQTHQRNYIIAGGGYTYSQRKRFAERWKSYIEDGLMFYRYDEAYWNSTTHAFALRVAAGRHIINTPHFLLDAYLGLGIRFASTSRPRGFLYNDPEPSTIDQDYSGVIGVVGVRMGIQW
jgi:hypothetical protein